MEEEKLLIRHTAKTKDDLGLKTIESRDRQFLIEKTIHNIEFKNHYQKPKIIERIGNNYKVKRRAYQSLFPDFAESFFEYIHSLDPDEIQELDSELKANAWGVQSITEIQDVHHLLTIFQMFYYLNGRLPFTNGLIIVPDGEVPETMQKIKPKNLYRMFGDTKSYGVVSLHFLCSPGIFFGLRPSVPKYALT